MEEKRRIIKVREVTGVQSAPEVRPINTERNNQAYLLQWKIKLIIWMTALQFSALPWCGQRRKPPELWSTQVLIWWIWGGGVCFLTCRKGWTKSRNLQRSGYAPTNWAEVWKRYGGLWRCWTRSCIYPKLGARGERRGRESREWDHVESHKNLGALLWPLALHIFYISN